MEMHLTKEQEKLVVDNLKLIHWVIIQKFYMYSANKDYYDEMFSLGQIALISAASKFDYSRNFKFSTYAGKCIINAIRDYIEQEQIEESYVLLLYDLIPAEIDPDYNHYYLDWSEAERYINLGFVVKIVDTVLNCLKIEELLIKLFYVSGMLNREIGEFFNLKSNSISVRRKNIETKINETLLNSTNIRTGRKKHNKKFFKVNLARSEELDYIIKISFSLRKVKNFQEIYDNFMRQAILKEGINDFKVYCRNRRCVIEMPMEQYYFYYLALLLYEIYKGDKSFKS